jgi:hypothetical protein
MTYSPSNLGLWTLCRVTLGERAHNITWLWGLVGPRVSPDAVERSKILSPAGDGIAIIQPVDQWNEGDCGTRIGFCNTLSCVMNHCIYPVARTTRSILCYEPHYLASVTWHSIDPTLRVLRDNLSILYYVPLILTRVMFPSVLCYVSIYISRCICHSMYTLLSATLYILCYVPLYLAWVAGHSVSCYLPLCLACVTYPPSSLCCVPLFVACVTYSSI